MLPTSAVGAPGTHGAGVTGVHAPGVSTPSAAAVWAAVIGLARLVHSPNGRMLTNGLLSMIVATGMFSTSAFAVGQHDERAGRQAEAAHHHRAVRPPGVDTVATVPPRAAAADRVLDARDECLTDARGECRRRTCSMPRLIRRPRWIEPGRRRRRRRPASLDGERSLPASVTRRHARRGARQQLHARARARPSPFAALAGQRPAHARRRRGARAARRVRGRPGLPTARRLPPRTTRPRTASRSGWWSCCSAPSHRPCSPSRPTRALRRAALVDVARRRAVGRARGRRRTRRGVGAGRRRVADPDLPLDVAEVIERATTLTAHPLLTSSPATTGCAAASVAARPLRRHRFLASPATATTTAGWAALVREATITGCGVDRRARRRAAADVGRRWIERADHLPWAISSRHASSPIDDDARPAVASSVDAPRREPTDEEWAAVARRRRAHPPAHARPAAPGQRAHAARRRRPRRRRAPARRRAARAARPAHPPDARRGTTSSSSADRMRAAARDRRPLPPRRPGLRRVGLPGDAVARASSRCSPARRAPARRWPPRSSPASSASTCSSSTCRRS